MIITPYERAVFYYETDKMGIVHHSNYIRWMEEARIFYLAGIGIPYDEIERKGIISPVLSVTAEYKKPFCYGDRFRIEVQLTEYSGVKFALHYDIFLVETGELHATGNSTHGFVDENMRPVRVKKEFPEIYHTLMKCVETNLTESHKVH